MPSKTRLVRTVTVATVATAFVALLPGVAHAALVGDWQMTDVGAPPPTMTDTSGLGNDGSPSGGILGDGNVFTFDGSGVVVVPDNGSVNPDGADITIDGKQQRDTPTVELLPSHCGFTTIYK